MTDKKPMTRLMTQLQAAKFPRWTDLPQFDLYMDQVIQYVNDVLVPLGFDELTATMVNNYVKKGVITAPMKKKYRPAQVANILVIALLKPVFALDTISAGIHYELQQRPAAQAYDAFILTFNEAILQMTSRFDAITQTEVDQANVPSTQATLMKLAISAVVQKLLVQQMTIALTETTAKEGKK